MLGSKFLLPLLVSPMIAVILAAVTYRTLRALRLRAGITRETVAVVSVDGIVLGRGGNAGANRLGYYISWVAAEERYAREQGYSGVSEMMYADAYAAEQFERGCYGY